MILSSDITAKDVVLQSREMRHEMEVFSGRFLNSPVRVHTWMEIKVMKLTPWRRYHRCTARRAGGYLYLT